MLQQSMNTGQAVLPRDSTPCSIYDCSILSPRTAPSAHKITRIRRVEKVQLGQILKCRYTEAERKIYRTSCT